jgi:transposase
MAMQVQRSLIGIDVAKDELVIYDAGQNSLVTIPNTPAAIRRWLKTLPGNCDIAIEATSTYHMTVTELAHKKGLHVYVIDGYQLSHYRQGIGGRAKTDACDAQLLARYLRNEKEDLRRWSPPPKAYRVLQSLLRRRAALVKARTALQQSLGTEPVLKAPLKSLIRRLDQLDLLIQRRLGEAVKEAGLTNQVKRCQAIEGVGPITAIGLVMAFLRGDFKSSDAFIAFLGLDVRVKDSGKHAGKRRLSKKGDSEVRRLLHCAAMTASRNPRWRPLYESYLARGLAKIQALVILSRKLARIAFTLMKQETDYQPAALV